MHHTAKQLGILFYSVYGYSMLRERGRVRVLELGSMDVNGGLRDTFQNDAVEYVGVDFENGPGVDIVLDSAYSLPFDSNSFDIVVASSVFEHTEFFWITILEIFRVLKSHGLFYMNAPSNGEFHRFPVDCWRFYPDSGVALNKWLLHNKYNSLMLESFTADQILDQWNDFVVVILKDQEFQPFYNERIIDKIEKYSNGKSDVETLEFRNHQTLPEDRRKLDLISNIALGKLSIS
jgi:SAM-dependent methyltransferase